MSIFLADELDDLNVLELGERSEEISVVNSEPWEPVEYPNNILVYGTRYQKEFTIAE